MTYTQAIYEAAREAAKEAAEKARAEGRMEGKAEGRMEGKAEGIQEMLFSFFDAGNPVEAAVRMFHLPEEAVREAHTKWLSKKS